MIEEHSHVTSFGYELIRDHVLASILGKHEKDILYWAGKDLARKFPLIHQWKKQLLFSKKLVGEHLNSTKRQKILRFIVYKRTIYHKVGEVEATD